MRGARNLFWSLMVLLGGTFVLGACGEPVPAEPVRPAPLVPASGALFGASVQPERALTRVDRMAMVTRLEAELGRRLDIHAHEYAWERPFPADLENWDVAVGRTPLISWGGASTARIAAGEFDAMIVQRADAVKKLGAPLFLRWVPEMEEPRHAPQAGAPEEFVRAWQHLWQLFRARGATNAVWVWCPSADGFPAANRYYPGDAFVDWVCAAGFNRGGARWRSFADIFQRFYAEWAGRKPLMVAETGTVEQGGDKARWIADAVAALKSRLPAIKAMVYRDAAGGGPGADWRVKSSPRAFAAYRAMAADRYFNPPTLSR